MTIKGSCLCGDVAFEIEGDFERFFICHCSYCRKDTGSAFASNLFTRIKFLKWLSGRENVRDYHLESTRHVKSFCSNCGSALPNTKMGGDICMVPAGCIDGDIHIKPEAHIFTDSRASWENALEAIKCYPGFPG